MTASYNPKPQRTTTKRVASAPKAPDPACVDRPAQSWQQLGGQLIDNRTYDGLVKPQRDNMSAIKDFIGEQGGHTGLRDWAETDYQEKIAEQVSSLYKKTAEAEVTNSFIADETRRLTAEKATAEAEQLLRRNNLANHYWYLKDAEVAGIEASIGLEQWGTNNAVALSGLDAQQRSLLIQKKRAELLAPFNLPEDYVAAYVDPKLLVADKSIKEAVIKEEFKLIDTQNKELSFKTITGNIENAATYKDIADTSGNVIGQQLIGFSTKKLQSAYNDGKASFIKHNPLLTKTITVVENGKKVNKVVLTKAGEREYNSQWFLYAPRLFLNKDGDNYNDVATSLNFGHYYQALRGVKTADGIPLLEIKGEVDGKTYTLEQQLRLHMGNAIKNRNMLENIVDDEERNAKAEAERSLKKLITNEFSKINTIEDSIALRNRIKALYKNEEGDYINIPPGYTPSTWFAKIDELVPEFTKSEDSTVTFTNKGIINKILAQEAYTNIDLINKDMSLVPYGFDGTWGDFFTKIQNGPSHKYLLEQLSANDTAAAGKVDEQVNSISDDLVSGLEANFKANSSILTELINSGAVDDAKRVNIAIEDAAEKAGDLLRIQSKGYIRSELLKLEPHERVKPENISRILSDAKRIYYEQPNFKDVTLWKQVDPSNQKTFNRDLPIPIGGTDVWDGKNGWTNGVSDEYSLKNWSFISRPYFVKGASGSEEGVKFATNYLNENFVLSDNSLNSVNEFLLTLDPSKLTPKAREDLKHLFYAFDNNVDEATIAKLQIGRLYSKGKQPIILDSSYQTLKEIVRNGSPIAKTGNEAHDENLIIYPEYTADQEGMEFKVMLNNGVQTSNRILTPFSGKVISVNEYEESGITVVLESDSPHMGAPKGTRVVIRHCGKSTVKEGDVVSAGNSLCIGGLHSHIPNSVDGSTTGNNIEAGHVVIQFLKPGTNLLADGSVGEIPLEPSTEGSVPDGFYEYSLGNSMPGLLSPDLQKTLFYLYVLPLYQEGSPSTEDFEIDLESSGFYNFPINTEE